MAYWMMSYCDGLLCTASAPCSVALSLMAGCSESRSGDQRESDEEANETFRISMMHVVPSLKIRISKCSTFTTGCNPFQHYGLEAGFRQELPHAAVQPPSMVITDPFTKSASDDAKYRAMCAISVACPNRPMGCLCSNSARTVSFSCL
jgi:hypothetical protein